LLVEAADGERCKRRNRPPRPRGPVVLAFHAIGSRAAFTSGGTLMVTMLVVACLIADPTTCREHRVDVPGGLHECVVTGQREAARLITDEFGPGWRVRLIRCTLGKPEVNA